jgi:hypothetical protein
VSWSRIVDTGLAKSPIPEPVKRTLYACTRRARWTDDSWNRVCSPSSSLPESPGANRQGNSLIRLVSLPLGAVVTRLSRRSVAFIRGTANCFRGEAFRVPPRAYGSGTTLFTRGAD